MPDIHILFTRTGWPRDLKTPRGTLQAWNMFRVEVKYLADNLSSCFSDCIKNFEKKSQIDSEGISQNLGGFELSMGNCPYTDYLFDKIYQD